MIIVKKRNEMDTFLTKKSLLTTPLPIKKEKWAEWNTPLKPNKGTAVQWPKLADKRLCAGNLFYATQDDDDMCDFAALLRRKQADELFYFCSKIRFFCSTRKMSSKSLDAIQIIRETFVALFWHHSLTCDVLFNLALFKTFGV